MTSTRQFKQTLLGGLLLLVGCAMSLGAPGRQQHLEPFAGLSLDQTGDEFEINAAPLGGSPFAENRRRAGRADELEDESEAGAAEEELDDERPAPAGSALRRRRADFSAGQFGNPASEQLVHEQLAHEQIRGLDTNIANAKIELTPNDMATAAGHHHHHKHYVHGKLEMGAHTGKKGAFGWHDKHPVGGKGRR